MKRKLLSILFALVLVGSFGLAGATPVAAAFNNFEGFEVNTGDWVAAQAITRVASGGGALNLTPSSGGFYAELQNLHDATAPGFGDGGVSYFGGVDSTYHGSFYQAIDVYINANWAPTLDTFSPDFWIDMSPQHPAGNYGAEHNFRLSANGSSVAVRVDNLVAPTATLTTSGWYTFMMTYEKAPLATDPVITEMRIYKSGFSLVGSTTVIANSPGGPFASSDLHGNGYVWLTNQQNGFASDLLGIDNVRTGSLVDVQTTKAVTLLNDADASGGPSPGDTLRYSSVIKNMGTGVATGVTFSDVPDANTKLVVGSVTTSQGSVSTGNSTGDTSVVVLLGTLPNGTQATVAFNVTINKPVWDSRITNQAMTTGTNFSNVNMSDDPGTPQLGDPTITYIHPSPPVPGPSLNEWGITAMVLLLGGAMVWVFRRKQSRSETHS